MERSLAAYLYSGVIAVGSRPDPTGVGAALQARDQIGRDPGRGAHSCRFGSFCRDAASRGWGVERRAIRLLQVQPLPSAHACTSQAAARVVGEGEGAASGRRSRCAGFGCRGHTIRHSAIASRARDPSRDATPGPLRQACLEVLAGATSAAAKLLGIDNRVGYLKPGFEASFILVEGNPLEDITATQRSGLCDVSRRACSP